MKKSSASSTWDNLISIKPGTDHRQYAGWKPAGPRRSGLGIHVLADQRIPVAEGIWLSADVFTPKVEGRYPAILVYGAYAKELHTAGVPAGTNETGSSPVFTDHGYVHIIITGRGMGKSDGKPSLFFSEDNVTDHEKCIAWASEQPWCDGSVVLFGTSYYGMVQPLVALRNPPALKAFFCNEICTDYFRHLCFTGGVPNLYFFNLWFGANFTDFMYRFHLSPFKRALISHITNSPLKPFWEKKFRKNLSRIMYSFMKKTPSLEARKWLANFLFEGKTRAGFGMNEGPYRQLKNIHVPFVVVQNEAMFNIHQFGSFDLYKNAGTAPDKKWLIVSEAEYRLPVYSWQLEAIAFYDHILFGDKNGYETQAPVRYWLEGKNEFKGTTAFPLPNSQKQKFYLSGNNNDRDIQSIVTNIPSGGKNSWEAIPIGLPMAGGMDEVINQTLSYEMTAEKDMEFSGPVSAHLRFSCNEIDSHVIARLGYVDSANTYHFLSIGTIRPARRRLDPTRSNEVEIAIDMDIPQPLIPDEPVDLVFSLTPAPVFLRRGEKLRFDIASRSDLLRSDVSHDHAHFDFPVPPYLSKNSVHYGADSYVELDQVLDQYIRS